MKLHHPPHFYLITLLLLAGLAACDSSTPPVVPESNNSLTPVSHEISLVTGCNSCHGTDGIGNKPDVPFIAGQPAMYLEMAMRSYLIGDRQHEVMREAVFDLEVSERHQLAAHFAQLDTAWTKSTTRTSRNNAISKARDIRTGQSLSRPCAGCHGKDGNSIKEGIPSLAGLQPEYFIPALKSYLQGKRRGAAIMKNFKLSLGKREIRQLAAYFAAQKSQRSPLGRRLKAGDASDTLASRCLGCHGENGNSTHPAIPSLSGQNAAYLMKAMQTYRDKKRQNKMMVDVAQGLSDEAIRRNAIYFATRTPTSAPTKAQPDKASTIRFNPMQDGAQLASSCNGCHGTNGNSTTTGVPRLAGLTQAYLQNAIRDYRDGQRQHSMMQILTRYLNDTDIEKLALYYANQTPSNPLATTDTDTIVDNELTSTCSGCHRDDGNNSTDTTPSLAGQNADYIMLALRAYKNGTRKNGQMKDVATRLNKKSILSLADYYSQLTPRQAKVRNMEAPEVLAKKCDRCHGKNGGEPDPDKPRIAGQRRDYLVKAINAYQNKIRINSMMYKMTVVLSQTEVEAIATYYSSQ